MKILFPFIHLFSLLKALLVLHQKKNNALIILKSIMENILVENLFYHNELLNKI